jgi:hypothetical protein
MNKQGRPAVRAVQLRDGFYIEVYTKENAKGIKIRSDTKELMEKAIQSYARAKDVIILGEYKGGEPVKKVN